MEEEKNKTQVEKNAPKGHLTRKGVALIAAIESGLLTEVDGGWDDKKFQKFWEMYNETLREVYPSIASIE